MTMITPASTLIRNLLLVLVFLTTGRAGAQVPVYTQPPYSSGGQYKSAWYAPDGLDSDEYVWDAFTLQAATAITQVRWRGTYAYANSGVGRAPVYDFTVAIYGSAAANTQPDIVGGPIVRYHTNSNAGETPAGSAGGLPMYDYQFTLPSAFQAAAGVKYWVQIEASQGLTPNYYWPPDWSIARGTGGEGSHFRKIGGTGGNYAFISGDCAFTLMASSAPTYTIDASAAPADAGTVTGAGAYPVGSSATLTASANPGFGFVRWTQNGSTVSTNQSYTFTVNSNRTLVANFTPAYSISTSALPTYGGTVTGGGTFNQGDPVTVSATTRQGFLFAGWEDYGTPVSTEATYTFSADADRSLAAVFVHDANSASFDFDNAPVHTSLPVSLQSGGVGLLLSGAYSIQPVGSLGISPPGFSGLCVYPNSVFQADLTADFSKPITYFSILYSTQELGCDDSARMRVTAFMNGTQVGTATTTAPTPGTWPSAFLEITVPGGFDRAVVHYDSRPPRCQDYGVIFMADNMTVSELVPTCDPDFNLDGNADQDDVAYLVNVIGGGDNPSARDPDFTGDGNADQDDVTALINTIGGGGCP